MALRLLQGLADVIHTSPAGKRTNAAAVFLAVHAHQARRAGELCAQAGDLFYCPDTRTHTAASSPPDDPAIRVDRVFHADTMHGTHARAGTEDRGEDMYMVPTGGLLPLQKLEVLDVPNATQQMFSRLSQDYESLLELYEFGIARHFKTWILIISSSIMFYLFNSSYEWVEIYDSAS